LDGLRPVAAVQSASNPAPVAAQQIALANAQASGVPVDHYAIVPGGGPGHDAGAQRCAGGRALKAASPSTPTGTCRQRTNRRQRFKFRPDCGATRRVFFLALRLDRGNNSGVFDFNVPLGCSSQRRRRALISC